MDNERARFRISYAYRMNLSKEDAVKLFVHTITFNPECAKLKKNIQRAVLYKKEGDSSFADSDYEVALKYYTKSLQLIPYNTDKEGIVYMSRSVTLKKLEAYEEAIMDAQRALKCPISEDLKKKLNTRINRLQSHLAKKSRMGKSAEKFHEDCPVVAYGENSEIPGASSAVMLSKDSQSTGCLVTVRPIKAGDVLLVQKPHIAVVDESDKDSVFTCHNCLKHYLAPVPCTSCARTLYCSVMCRTKAYNNHKYECDVSACQAIEFTAALRMLIVIANQGRGADGGLLENCHRAIDSLVPLVLSDKEKDENDHELNYLSSFMAVSLKTKADLFEEDYDVCGLAHVILRLGYLFQANAVRIKCSSENNIPGIAVYPVFKLLQYHDWNTISYTYGTTVKVLRASRDIAQGEQIFENEYEAISHKTVIQFEGIELVDDLHVWCSHNKYPDDVDMPKSIEKMKLPQHLERRLRKSPNNIRCMWEVMDFMNKNTKKPCLAFVYMKMFLEDAYMNCENAWLREFYTHIGLW